MITKKLIKNGKKNTTDYEVCVLENEAVTVSNQQTNSSANGFTNGFNNGNVNGSAVSVTNGFTSVGSTNLRSPVLSKDYQIMLQCMTEAMMLRDELGHDVDVNKLGIKLFLRKVKP